MSALRTVFWCIRQACALVGVLATWRFKAHVPAGPECTESASLLGVLVRVVGHMVRHSFFVHRGEVPGGYRNYRASSTIPGMIRFKEFYRISQSDAPGISLMRICCAHGSSLGVTVLHFVFVGSYCAGNHRCFSVVRRVASPRIPAK